MSEPVVDDRGQRRVLTGKVVADKMEKTIVVEVSRRYKHRMYKKYVNRSKRYKAHDESNEANVGDVVSIRESRPMSKEKRWRLIEIKTRAAN